MPDSGVYRVEHVTHVLPREVTLLKDQLFPKCAACEAEVMFLPVRMAPGLEHSGVRIALYELPVVDDRREAGMVDPL